LTIEQGGTDQDKAARDEPSRRDRRPTLKTIAQITGLGITTVSRALKDGLELSVATRARVREVADQFRYRPHRAGVRLRTGRTYVIGLILDQNNTVAEFERRIILGVSRVLAHTNYHLVVMPLMQNADLMEPIRYFVETAAADGSSSPTRSRATSECVTSSSEIFPSSAMDGPNSTSRTRSMISTTSASRSTP
jgi:LacI family transcriptional regulator